MTLANYQGQSNGLTFGPSTNVQLISIDGLRSADTNSGDIAAPRQNGALAGFNTIAERTLVLTFCAFNPTVPVETVLAAVTAAFQPISDPSQLQLFQFMLPGWASARQVTGRTTKGAIPIDANYNFNLPSVAVEFTCPDPLVYDSVLQQAQSGLPSPTAGLHFNVTFPVTFGASTGGSFQLTNSGNYAAPFTVTITGPCTNPLLTLGSQFLAFNVTLGASDVLVIDTAAQTATLNGTADRTGTIVTGSTWLTVPPGTSSIGVASSDSAAVAALFVGALRNAWGFM